jgi:hypothetical protein
VMSDAEIELCTGHPVHYDTGAVADRTTAQAPPNTHASG